MAKLQKTKLQAMVPVREQELVWVLQLQMLLKVLQLRRLQLRRLQLRRLQPVLRLLHLQLPRLQLRRLQLRRLQPVVQPVEPVVAVALVVVLVCPQVV